MKNSSTNIAQGELTSTSILHFPSQYLWKATFGPLHTYLNDRRMWWPSSFQIEDYLGYWLFYAQRCVAHAFSEVLQAYCVEREKPYVVTPSQWGVMSLLNESDGLAVGTISQRRGLDAPTVTGILRRLEQSGLVERRHSCEDRRVVEVYLTAEERDIVSSLVNVVRDFHEVMTRGFLYLEIIPDQIGHPYNGRIDVWSKV